jgi:hypothetical protein
MATPSELLFGATVQSEQHPDPRTFLRWLDKKGISRNKCELHGFPRTGRGVMASANMKAGDVVVEVCFSSTVNPEKVQLHRACSRHGVRPSPCIRRGAQPRTEKPELMTLISAKLMHA